MKNDRQTKRSPLPVVLALLLVGLFAAGAWVFISRNYVRLGTELLDRDSETLDLRGKGLASAALLEEFPGLGTVDLRGNPLPAEELLALRARHPDWVILCGVPLGDAVFESTAASVTVPDLGEDWENLALFLRLEELTVERCSRPERMAAVAALLPDTRLRWALSLGGQWVDAETEALTLAPGTADGEELARQLPYLSALRSLTVSDALTPGEQRRIRDVRPDVVFDWPVTVGDRLLPSDTASLTLGPGEFLDLAALGDVLDLLPALGTLELTDSAVPGEARSAFVNAHPEIAAHWTVELLGETYPWDTAHIDLNGTALADTAELEAALPYLPRLETVEMCDTGLSNETMAALNRRWEGTDFVWKVHFSGYTLRTDAEYFVASLFGDPPPAITNEHLGTLAYCTKLRGLDLGHMYFTDLSFLQSMPHMTYLILAESSVTDLSPLAGLKELKYLEIFKTAITDLSPLLECPALEDLNICYTWVGADNAMAVLPQMKQLERLWWCNTSLSQEQQRELQEALPDCITFFLRGGESSGGIWRYHENYYEMRDFFHMWYMPGGTNGVDDDGAQIIIDDHGREFHLKGYDYTYQRWWEDPRYSYLNPYIIGITDS